MGEVHFPESLLETQIPTSGAFSRVPPNQAVTLYSTNIQHLVNQTPKTSGSFLAFQILHLHNTYIWHREWAPYVRQKHQVTLVLFYLALYLPAD